MMCDVENRTFDFEMEISTPEITTILTLIVTSNGPQMDCVHCNLQQLYSRDKPVVKVVLEMSSNNVYNPICSH